MLTYNVSVNTHAYCRNEWFKSLDRKEAYIMCTIIHGIPVVADPTLSQKKTNRIVAEVIRSWNWEGRQIGKIELICDGKWVHVCSYEKPSIQIFSNN